MKLNKDAKFYKNFKRVLELVVSNIIVCIITCIVTLTFNSLPTFIAEQAIYMNGTGEYLRNIYIYNVDDKLLNATAKLHYVMRFYGYNNDEICYEFYTTEQHGFVVEKK